MSIGEGKIDIKEVIEAKEELLKDLRKEKYWDVLEAYPGIEYRDCRARFLKNGVAQVGSDRVTFHKAVLATGSRPALPPVKNLHRVRYMTSDEVLSIDHLPRHLIVLGGGAIGLELGQAFLRMGSRVMLIEALPDIAMGEEPELRKRLREVLEGEGMEILTGATVKVAEQEGDQVKLLVEQEGGSSR